MGDEMRVLLFLLLACAGWAFDTTYVPGQHNVIFPFQCDDRVDSQFVNIANEWGIVISFAPYRDGSTQITDYDSVFATGAYNTWLNGWARQQGMPFATHAQHQSPTIYASYGAAGLDSVFDFESNFVQNTAGGGVPMGHVWTGHVNSPITRAYAKGYGYTYTRGDFGNSPDLYLSMKGWEAETGSRPYPPMCMTHRALVPSFSMYRLTGYASADSLYQRSTAADTTNLFRRTVLQLNEMARNNAFGVANIHPGWGNPHAETASDTIAAVWVRIDSTYAGLPDSILFSTRRGNPESVLYERDGRNDVSAYQLDYILHAMDWWDDSCLVADGVRRLCIPNIDEIMVHAGANWRNDNSDDYTAVSTTAQGWTTNTALMAKDPELDRERIVYIDGSGTVKAGNGTSTYPLPGTALTSLFNSKVIFTGHAAGDTLILQRPAWRGGNVDVDFAGLTIVPETINTSAVMVDSTSQNFYLHNITLRNFTLNGLATTATTPVMYVGNSAAAVVDSLRVTDFTLKGATLVNAEQPVYLYNAKRAVIDSCYFKPGTGEITNNSITWALFTGTYAASGLVRNSVFDMSDCGGGTAADAGSAISGAIQMAAHAADSLRVLNNVFILGNAADTDDYQAVLRTPAVNSTLKVRLAGNYISSSGIGANAAKVWLFTTGYAAGTLTQFADTMALYNSGTYVPTKNYLATGWGIGGFDYPTEASDSIRFGGYLGTGSLGTTHSTWIGPSTFGYFPLVWTSGAVQGRSAYATMAGPWEVLSLVNKGVFTTSSATNTATWFEIPRIYDESSLAVARGFLDAWEKWPSANQAKVRFKVSGEPVTVITSADSTYQTLGQLVNALAGNVAAETAADSLTASTWFSLPRPYTPSAAFQTEILRAWWRVLPDTSKVRVRFRVAGTDFSMTDTDSVYSQGLWGLLADIGTGATASDSLNADTWFMAPRVYDMAQAQQFGIYEDAWKGWPLATQKKVRLKTK